MDNRHIENGRIIPGCGYCDQPYIVHTSDGGWLCVMTTGAGVEGASGQHVVSMRSFDRGVTWQDIRDVEPADGPEASYAVTAVLPTGRILCLYNYNADNVRSILGEDGKRVITRVDSLGHYVFRYSDDNGLTWSQKRYDIPVRVTDVDKRNIYGGKLRFFWNVGKPFMKDGKLYAPLIKIGGFNEKFMNNTEGWLLCCENPDAGEPTEYRWKTLPKGDKGLRAPVGGGSVSEEHSYTVLSDGSIFAVARSVNGHPTEYYSRDGGESFSEPTFMTYDGVTPFRHPRAANFVWRCENGRYLYWFHNNGTKSYENRNPVFVCGGIEEKREGGNVLRWSQPEVLLYDDDPRIRMSYPDMVEDDGRYYFTETQKFTARVHEFDGDMFEGMWASLETKPAAIAAEGLARSCANKRTGVFSLDMPRLTPVSALAPSGNVSAMTRGGFTIELWVVFDSAETGQVIASSMENGIGWEIGVGPDGRLAFEMSDGVYNASLKCKEGLLQLDKPNHIAITVDAGPCIMSFCVNGTVSDGGERAFGFARFANGMGDVSGGDKAVFGAEDANNVRVVRIYSRALRNYEILSNYRYGF